MPITLTPTQTNSFNGANQNPLDPTNWTIIGGGLPTNDQVQILNAVATTTIQVEADGTIQNNNSFNNDQYQSFRIKELTTNGAFFMYLRGGAQLEPSLVLACNGPLGDTTGISTYSITQLAPDGESDTYEWVNFAPITFALNDIITFAVIGTSLYFIKNGVVISKNNTAASPSPLTSGALGMQLATVTPAVTDIGVDTWAAGTASGSAPGPGSTIIVPNRNIQLVQRIQGLSF